MSATATTLILTGRRVKVYRNLTRRCWSVVSMERGPNYGRVIAHASDLALVEARCHVSASGRERVRRTRKKEVHAWITGRVASVTLSDPARRTVYYNPRKVDTFTVDGQPVTVLAGPALFAPDGRVYTTP